MSAPRTGSNRSVDEFLTAMLEQTCFLKCNPSSLYQTLVFGSENSSQHTAELKHAKEDCVTGCQLAGGKPMKAAVAASLIMPMEDDLHHRQVLSKGEKQRIIMQQVDFCDRIKAACLDECVADCTAEHGKDSTRSTRCSLDCARGCKLFVSGLSYSS